LRSILLFSLAAFSFAKAATCSDFDVFANGTSIGVPPGNSSKDFSIMIGEDLVFTVKSKVANDTSVFVWTRSGVPLVEGTSYPVPIGLEATGNIPQTVLLRVRNCGYEKSIIIELLSRPYEVTFDLNGGDPPPPPKQIIEPGETATEPANPPKNKGYDFDGWEMPLGTPYDFGEPVMDNITLVAAWTPKEYTITFKDGNTTLGTQTVKYGDVVGELLEPTKEGYEFGGWWYGNKLYADTTKYTVTTDIELSVKWEPIRYTISFDVNVGDCMDGTANPESIRVEYDKPIGNALPKPTRVAHKFLGWFSLEGEPYTSATVYKFQDSLTLYAKWEFEKNKWKPTADLLDFTIPDDLVYTGTSIAPITAIQVAGNCGGTLGEITILYDGKETLPVNAGTYAVSARIAPNETGDYLLATVSLGPLTIAKAPATASVISVTVKPKIYSADSLAEIEDITFNISPLYGEEISEDDYIANAYFASSNAGTQRLYVVVHWRSTGPLSKNYIISPSPLIDTTVAVIERAPGELRLVASPPYDLNKQPYYKYTSAETYANPVVEKPFYIPDSAVQFDYRKEDPTFAYTTIRPNRIGRWWVRATLPGNSNYTGAQDSMLFMVERGSAKPVEHEIEIPIALENNFKKDAELSGKLRNYYVGDICDSEREDSIKITIIGEPDIILKLNMASERRGNENLGYYYKVPFNFDKTGISKPGLDTLIYMLTSTDNLYKEFDTLYIETPIAFDSIAKQKWNNVLLINNNPMDNGGYEFTDFKWFKNGKETDTLGLQFYSAGPKSTDVLKQSDVYKVTMHTKDGIRISTCEGHSKRIVAIPAAVAEKPAATKQVLGINGKTAKPEQKVYNASGVERKTTPAGVYIVKDK